MRPAGVQLAAFLQPFRYRQFFILVSFKAGIHMIANDPCDCNNNNNNNNNKNDNNYFIQAKKKIEIPILIYPQIYLKG